VYTVTHSVTTEFGTQTAVKTNVIWNLAGDPKPLLVSEGFVRDLYDGETVDLGTVTYYWDGTGRVCVSAIPGYIQQISCDGVKVDGGLTGYGRFTIVGPAGTIDHVKYPQDISGILVPGANAISISVRRDSLGTVGYLASVSSVYIVHDHPPVSEFRATKPTGMVPLTTRFQNLAGSYITSSLWSFGDGATSPEPNPVHTYTTPGTYTVSLVASSDIGVDTMTKTDMVAVEAPDFDFTADVVEGIVPLAVQFTDISTEPYPTTWAWDFGDGETAAVKDPLHLYKLPGIYTVILTASNQYYTDIIIKQAMISIDGKISGSVCDAWVRYEQEQDVPIPSVQIACGDYPVVLTDGSGEFSFIAPSSVPVGTRFRISARVDGCITATKQFVYTGDTVVDPFRLWPHPVL
jgi:PKD repeat protein